ncbi:nitrosoguanidine resistance protein Sng1p [Monosporozyma servazzii]
MASRRNSLISNIANDFNNEDTNIENGTRYLENMVTAPCMPDEKQPHSNEDITSGDTNCSDPSTTTQQTYRPEQLTETNQDDDTEAQLPQLTKTGTTIFSPHMKSQRRKILYQFIKIILTLMVFIFTVFPLFWGASYDTASHYPKVHSIAVIQEDIITPDMENITVPMTSVLPQLIDQAKGTWHVYNSTGFADKYNIPNDVDSIEKKMIHLIFSEKYWLAINIKPNSTANLYNALTNTSSDFFNTTSQYDLIYESGRDPSTVKPSIYPLGMAIQAAFRSFYTTNYLPSMVSNITSANLNVQNAVKSGSMVWNEIDYRPYTERLLMVVTQICCVYLIILTVFQYLNFAPLHAEVSKMLTDRSKIIYRVFFSFGTFFILSLFFCTVTAMYSVDFTKSFGRGGFMIYWMSTWLFMWAVGGANENIISLIFAIRPPFLGFWILGFVATNIATSFFPFVLNNNFYRFGYMMPVHNLMAIYRVIFLDLSRHQMGRNYGVLVAWVALDIITLPLFMKLTSKLMMRKMKKEAELAAAKPQN